MKQHFGKYLGPTLIDESQPLSAWRTWRLGLEGRDRTIRLTGTWAKNTVWTPKGGVTVAQCFAAARQKSECNVSMSPDCECGLWAAIAITNLLKHGAIALYPTGVLGRVHLWGFVHVYEFGVRAMMGRPVEVWLGSTDGKDAALRVEREYHLTAHVGLPVEVVVDPDLLAPKRVLAAARAYLAAQHAQAGEVPRGHAVLAQRLAPSGRRPNLRVPDGRRKCACGYRHRSGDQYRTCEEARAAVAKKG